MVAAVSSRDRPRCVYARLRVRARTHTHAHARARARARAHTHTRMHIPVACALRLHRVQLLCVVCAIVHTCAAIGLLCHLLALPLRFPRLTCSISTVSMCMCVLSIFCSFAPTMLSLLFFCHQPAVFLPSSITLFATKWFDFPNIFRFISGNTIV